VKINKDDIKKRIIYRASYRGTKELDILISSFVNKIINNLNTDELVMLENFVNLDDEELTKIKLKIQNNNQKINKIYKQFYSFKLK
tara:strand:+ start:1558 stop:1815 length:258 start_codon:yes stop_codon:yes gene_type:complete